MSTDNGHTVTDDETIAEEFDNDFVNIGKALADVIASSSTYNLNFTTINKNKNSLFFAKLFSSNS